MNIEVRREGKTATLVNHSLLSLVNTGTDAVGAALVSALLGRLLGVKSMGQFGYAQVLSALLLAGTSVGVPAFASQRMAQAAGRSEPTALFLEFALSFLLVVATPAAAVVLAGVLLVGQTGTSAAVLAAGLAWATSLAILALAHAAWRSEGEFRGPLYASLATKAALIIGVIVVWLRSWPLEAYLAIGALTHCAAAATLIASRWPGTLRGALRAPHRREWQWIRAAVPFGAMILLEASMFRVDTILVEWVRGGAETGLYVAAFTIYTLPLLLSYSVTTAFYPWLTRAWAAGAEVRSTSTLVTWALGLYGACCAVVIWFAAPLLVRLVFGGGLEAAGPVLKILGLALPAATIARQGLASLKAKSRIREATFFTGAALVTAVVGNLIWTPGYGILGAAWVNLGAEMVLASAVLWSKWPSTESDNKP